MNGPDICILKHLTGEFELHKTDILTVCLPAASLPA